MLLATLCFLKQDSEELTEKLSTLILYLLLIYLVAVRCFMFDLTQNGIVVHVISHVVFLTSRLETSD